MKLTKEKDRRQSPTSPSASTSRSGAGLSTINETSDRLGSAVEVFDGSTPQVSSRKMTKTDQSTSRYSPSSFFLGRTFSFGTKRSKNSLLDRQSTKLETKEEQRGLEGRSEVTPKIKPTLSALDFAGPISPLPSDSPSSPTCPWVPSDSTSVDPAATTTSYPAISNDTTTTSSSSSDECQVAGPSRLRSSPHEVSSRRLVKRRPVSIIHEGIEPIHRRSSSSTHRPSPPVALVAYGELRPLSAENPFVSTAVSSYSTPLDGHSTHPAFPGVQDQGWTSNLERNGSSSTAASSLMGASLSTSESALLETPTQPSEQRLASDESDYEELANRLSDPDLGRLGEFGLSLGEGEESMSLVDFLSLKRPSTSSAQETLLHPSLPSQSSATSVAGSSLTVQSVSSDATCQQKDTRISDFDRPQAGREQATSTSKRMSTGLSPEDDRAQERLSSLHRSSSATGSRTSTCTGSIYSEANVSVATEGFMSKVRIIDVPGAPTMPSTPVKASFRDSDGPDRCNTNVVSLKSRIKPSKARFTIDHEEEHRQPERLTLRNPPQPPHLARLHLTQESPSLSAASDSPDRDTSAPRRPNTLPRSSSLGQLWRRMSTTDTREKKPTRAQTEKLSKSPKPKRRSSRFDEVAGPSEPDVPSPVSPVAIKELIRKASLGRLRALRSSRPPTEQTPTWPPPVPVLSSETEVPAAEGKQEVIRQPVGLRSSPRSSSILQVPLAATPLVRSPIHVTPLENQTEDYFGVQEHNKLHPIVTYGSPDSTLRENSSPVLDQETKEKRRKYRQTLVEIKDDLVFHQVLADLARLQSTTPTPQDDPTSQEPLSPEQEPADDVLEMRPRKSTSTKGVSRSPSSLISERKAREQNIRAWFVTREIVQGERRHGRVLARGVATVRRALESIERNRNGASEAPTRSIRSKSSMGIRRKGVSFDHMPTAQAQSRLESSPAQAAPSPIVILLNHLPRLLAVSLTLSSRFEHDPSPIGVAKAFCMMEAELSNEIGLWAGEVGNLVAMGLGSFIEQENRHTLREGSEDSEKISEELDPDERLGISDIILMPITRALRYTLLFRELLAKMPNNTTARTEVESALRASDRLAAECDRRQVHNLEALRRGRWGKINDEMGGKIKKNRPRSLGMSASSTAIATRAW